MTDTPATKQDLRELEVRIEVRFSKIDARFEYSEKHLDNRLAALSARFHGQLADLEHRMTVRLGGVTVAAIGAVSALVKLL